MNPVLVKLLVALAALGIAFGGGYYIKGRFDTADQVDAVVEARHETAQGVQQSLQIDTKTNAAVDTSNQQVDAARLAVAARIKKQETQTHEAAQADPRPCIRTLDVGTVRLLNDAAAGRTPDATLVGDGEVQAIAGTVGSR